MALKPAVPNTVVITLPLGEIFLRLLDKTGRLVHDASKFHITDQQRVEGETDSEGRLLVEEVLPGNYQLELDVDVNRSRAPLAEGKGTTPTRARASLAFSGLDLEAIPPYR